jgi:hypothetical protein
VQHLILLFNDLPQHNILVTHSLSFTCQFHDPCLWRLWITVVGVVGLVVGRVFYGWVGGVLRMVARRHRWGFRRPRNPPSAPQDHIVIIHLRGWGNQTWMGVNKNVWFGSALRLHQILGDRSNLIYNVTGVARTFAFELSSRLFSQPIIQDFLRPPLIGFNFNQRCLC